MEITTSFITSSSHNKPSKFVLLYIKAILLISKNSTYARAQERTILNNFLEEVTHIISILILSYF